MRYGPTAIPPRSADSAGVRSWFEERTDESCQGEKEGIITEDPEFAGPRPVFERVDINRRPPLVTYILMGANIAAFIAMTVLGGSTDPDVLVVLGAKDSALIWQGQYWRLLTPVFLHAGLMHLAFNTYALFQLGRLVEALYGRGRMLTVYLLAGVMATVASLIGSPALSVGASGAIFGLFGALLYFARQKPRAFRAIFGSRLYIVLAVNIFIGFTLPSIDNYAHLGGLVAGFLLAFAVGLPGDRLKVRAGIAVALIFAAVTLYGLFPTTSSWRYHYAAGRSMLVRGKASAAAGHLESAYRERPGDSQIRLYLAQAHYEVGKSKYRAREFLPAAAEFERSAGLVPTPEGHLAVAVCYASAGNYARARQECLKALSLKADYQPAKDLLKQLGDE